MNRIRERCIVDAVSCQMCGGASDEIIAPGDVIEGCAAEGLVTIGVLSRGRAGLRARWTYP